MFGTDTIRGLIAHLCSIVACRGTSSFPKESEPPIIWELFTVTLRNPGARAALCSGKQWNYLLSASLVLVATLIPKAVAQTTCTTSPAGDLIRTVPGNTSSSANGDPSVWAGWQSDFFLPSYLKADTHFQGFPMNLSLAYGVGPADLPPRSTELSASSSPLIPLRPAFYQGSYNYPERARAGGIVDLITGAPLLQEVDFELPFGGAMYRHVRTYGEVANSFWHEAEAARLNESIATGTGRVFPTRGNGASSEAMWDWNGQGWMVGDNPVMLFDACYLGVSAFPANGSAPATEHRITYFIPDAHHSIPFVRNNDGTYTAPPQFDAAMECVGGTWDTQVGEWSTPPLSVNVWLQRRTVKYHVILKWYKDANDKIWGENCPVIQLGGHTINLHNSPISPTDAGTGMPYLGLTTEISDRAGNRMLLDYVPQQQYETAVLHSDPSDIGCKVCQQNVPEFGQIRSVKLMAAEASDTDSPAWTIVFSYRDFYDNSLWPVGADDFPEGSTPAAIPGTNPPVPLYKEAFLRHRQTAIESIHVYCGAITIPPMSTISASQYVLRSPPPPGEAVPAASWLDSFELINPQTLFGLSENWIYEVKYSYSDPQVRLGNATNPRQYNINPNSDTPDTIHGNAPAYTTGFDGRSPLLVHRRVSYRPTIAQEAGYQRDWIYHWETAKFHLIGSQMLQTNYLARTYSPTQVDRMVRGIKAARSLLPGDIGYGESGFGGDGDPRTAAETNVNDLLALTSDRGIPLVDALGQLVLVDVGIPEAPHKTLALRTYWRWAETSFGRAGLLGPDSPPNNVPLNPLALIDHRRISGVDLTDPSSVHKCIQMLGGVDRSVFVESSSADATFETQRCAYVFRYLVNDQFESLATRMSSTIEGGKFPSFKAQDTGWVLGCPVGDISPSTVPQVGRGLLHYPYRLIASPEDLLTSGSNAAEWYDWSDSSKVTWIALVWESEARRDVGSNQWSFTPFSVEHPNKVRVVEMNKTGVVLHDNTWFEDGTTADSNLEKQLSEQVIYDGVTHTRVVERRTSSWTSQENAATRQTDGLVEVHGYEYATPPNAPDNQGLPAGNTAGVDPRVVHIVQAALPPSGMGPQQLSLRLAYDGVKLGASETPTTNGIAVSKSYGYDTSRPDLLSYDASFATPRTVNTVSDLEGAYVRGYQYLYHDPIPDRGIGPKDRIAETVTTTVVPTAAANGNYYGLVERQLTNPAGNVIFEARGYCYLSGDPKAPVIVSEPSSFTAWRHSYDSSGRRLASYRCGWTNYYSGEVSPPWRMMYTYDTSGRMTSMVDGDQTVTYYTYRVSASDPHLIIKRTYPRVNTTAGDSKFLWIGGPVLEESIRDGQTEFQVAISVAGPVSQPPTGNEAGVELWRMVATRDGFGRLGELMRTAGGAPSASAQIGYDSFGQVWKLKDSNGTIVRTLRDSLGRVERVFRGTNDQHEVWGTLVLGDPCSAIYPDNMALVERHEFGYGLRTAGQSVSNFRYRERPQNQYRLTGCTSIPSNNEDSLGIVERHQFDCRLRDVWMATCASPGATQATRIVIHYYDNLNRERFSATLPGSAAVPSSVDPTRRDLMADVPSPAEILAAGPIELSEKRYDDQGRVIESRVYDVNDPTGSSYSATRSQFDHENRVVWQQDAGGRTTRSTYESHGWLQSVAVSASGVTGSASEVEIEKTTYIYDASGNAIEIDRLERTHDGTGDSLASTNSVLTRTFQWFDWRHQLVASAQLGTEDSGNRFASGASLVQRSAFSSAPCTYDSGTGRLTGFSRGSLSQSAMITCYEYDIEGRQIGMVDSGGAVTRTEYDGMGRVLAVTNNALAPTGSNAKQITAYKYDASGRLSRIAAVKAGDSAAGINWDATDGSIQVTAVDYGAAVKNPSGTTLFSDGDLLAAIRFPDATTGQPATNGLAYSYLLTGEVAERIDQRTSSRLGYGYDERGNLSTIDITTPNGILQGLNRPVDQVGHVEFQYDAANRMVTRRSFAIPTSPNDPPEVIEKGQYEYDGRGNLTRDFQQHGLDVISQSPVIDYVRQFISDSASSGIKNVDRLTKIVYPDRDLASATGLRRQIQMGYGNAGGVDDALSRIVDMQEVSRTQHLATFGYAGESRRVDFGLGVTFTTTGPPAPQNYVARSFARSTAFSGVGYDRLDSLGRIKDLNYSSTYSYAPTIFDAQLTYNAGGDLTSELVTQATVGGVTHNNDRSWKFTYDALHRLTGANRGHFNTTSGQIDTSTSYRNETWWLDRLGGWSGDGTNPGQRIAQLVGSNTTTTDYTQNLDQFNALKSLRKQTGATVTTTAAARDGAGNLICDGSYVYQYDAFNRLVQVNERGNVTVQSNGTLSGIAGPWIKHYTYDGLGRLIRTQSPWPWPDTAPAASQSERYYYDGYRRIQKVLIDPIALDDDKQPIKISKEVDLTKVNIQYNAAVDREYVWDPTDTDRLLCQYQGGSNPYYITTDQTWTPTAQLDASGHVTDQFSFDPYGTLLSYDHGSPSGPDLEVGHQGLFFDRLDAALLNTDGSENPRLAASAVGIYYNRARTYSPSLGRFLQADPNATGMASDNALLIGARPTHPEVLRAETKYLYRDGASIFCYEAASPLGKYDPTGMFLGLDLTASQAIKIGMQSVQYSYAVKATLNLADSLLSGIGTEQALLEFAVAGVGLAGTPLFDAALDSYLSFRAGFAVTSAAAKIGATAEVGESFLLSLGGDSQVTFQTAVKNANGAGGGRVVDQFANGIANESKVGYASLTSDIAVQVEKDAWLLANDPRVKGVVWHFFTSPVTGQIGPSQPLQDLLISKGIQIILHP